MGGIIPQLVNGSNFSRVRWTRIVKFCLDKKKDGEDSKEV